MAACREESVPRIPDGRIVLREGGSARSVLALAPSECRVGEVFRRQPNGQAELVVLGTGLTRGDAVSWNGRRLKTNFASSRALSVDVPPELVASPGEVDVTVDDLLDPMRPKLHARFYVRPPAQARVRPRRSTGRDDAPPRATLRAGPFGQTLEVARPASRDFHDPG